MTDFGGDYETRAFTTIFFGCNEPLKIFSVKKAIMQKWGSSSKNITFNSECILLLSCRYSLTHSIHFAVPVKNNEQRTNQRLAGLKRFRKIPLIHLLLCCCLLPVVIACWFLGLLSWYVTQQLQRGDVCFWFLKCSELCKRLKHWPTTLALELGLPFVVSTIIICYLDYQ